MQRKSVTGGVPGKRTLTEQIQRRAGSAPAVAGDVHAVAEAGVAGGGEPLPHLDRIQESFGPDHDVSHVRAHVGGDAALAARGIGAEAYAMGDRAAFASAPDLHTAAHEAAHVVQQQGGVQLYGGIGDAGDVHERHADAVADRVVRGESSADLLSAYSGGGGGAARGLQMRRLSSNLDVLLTDPNTGNAAPNADATLAGEELLLERTLDDLAPADMDKVRNEIFSKTDIITFLFKTPKAQQFSMINAAVLKVRPDLKLGDPKLIDTGARKGTDDAKNMKKLGTNAGKVFDKIIKGSNDKDLEDVFGKKNVATAKAKYQAAKTWMNNLLGLDKVVTDRSGYNDEVNLGGLTGFHNQIALAPSVIDAPDDPLSIDIMIHESMHAGNSDVSDKGYIGQPSFVQLPEDVKLTNAAHFEVVPRRILGITDGSFPGVVFVPAGSTVGGVTAPPLTDVEQAIRGASEKFRLAWTIGLNLHTLFDRVIKDPTQWSAVFNGGKFSDGLPYWSKVEKLTIHLKNDIDPTSSNPAKLPVSEVDMALSEGLVRRLAKMMDGLPQNEADAKQFEKDHASSAEVTAGTATVASHTDFLIKLMVAQPGNKLTGTVDRDVRVVNELATLNWGEVTKKGPPSGFPD